MHRVDQVRDVGQYSRHPAGKVRVKQVRVQQVDPPLSQDSRQATKLAHVPLAPHAQHLDGNALGKQHLLDFPALQPHHAHVEPPPVQPARQFIHDPLGSRGPQLRDQLADANGHSPAAQTWAAAD